MNDALLGGLFLGVCVLIGVFLALRAVLLWYWRVPDIISRLDRIATALEARSTTSPPMNTSTSAANSANGSAITSAATADRTRAT
jgi:hypothetical protein